MINLFIVYSLLEREETVIGRYTGIIKSIKEIDREIQFSGCVNSRSELNPDLFKDTSGVILLLASGGTEKTSMNIITRSEAPALICAGNEINSFAASLELYAFLKDNYKLSLFYYQSREDLLEKINTYSQVCGSIAAINNAKIGLIGEPSDWLLTSKGIDSFGKFKTNLLKFSTEDLIDEIENLRKVTKEKNLEMMVRHDKLKVPDFALSDSMTVYRAVKNLAERNNLSGITIRCFDLLNKKYTACIAMALCNDHGIVSGCEGDLHAVFSLMIGYYLTGEPGWMANPSSVDKSNNSITFAHCTAPTKFLDPSAPLEINTHMESGLSCAVEGSIKKEKVTVFRTGGCFDKLIAAKGKVVESGMRNPLYCRTQAVIQLECDTEAFINSTYGNHHVIVYGDVTERLRDFCHYSEIEFKQV